MIRTNLNPMWSGPPMALSKRPQHAALGPLMVLYMESLNGWCGLPVAQYGIPGSGPLIALSVRSHHAVWGTVWEIPKGPIWAFHGIVCEAQTHGSEVS